MIYRFTSPDIQACRDWLRLFGFWDGSKGWMRRDGTLGGISHHGGLWHAWF